MKRSRLKMFKITSMTISILGVVMIVATVAVLAYFGFQSISSLISSDASSDTAIQDLASLKTEYNSLKMDFDNVKTEVMATNNKALITSYDNARLELVKTQSAISDVDSALTVGKPSDEVNRRLEIAKGQIQKAKTSLSNIKAQV